jgi:hypothetical protein
LMGQMKNVLSGITVIAEAQTDVADSINIMTVRHEFFVTLIERISSPCCC